jgi:hypothetical protein
VQVWWLQLIGAAVLVTCSVLFVRVHKDMGDSWSPEPEQKANHVHKLVTHGTFRWARHPMYAVFLWAVTGTLLSTLNLVVTLCVSGVIPVMLRRIKTEERILVELFGGDYLDYRRRVSALGPPWCCLGFDGEMQTALRVNTDASRVQGLLLLLLLEGRVILDKLCHHLAVVRSDAGGLALKRSTAPDLIALLIDQVRVVLAAPGTALVLATEHPAEDDVSMIIILNIGALCPFRLQK